MSIFADRCWWCLLCLRGKIDWKIGLKPNVLRLGMATTKAGWEERANSKVINSFNALREDKSLYLALRKNRYSRMAIAMYFGSR